MTEHTVKTTSGQLIGVGTGNALAWATLEALKWQYQYAPDDPVTTAIMLGTIFSGLALQARKFVAGAKYVFDRFFPEKKDD